MSIVYLDNNATTRVDPAVLSAMLPFFGERYGNPSSMHTFGGEVGRDIAAAREQTAELLGCSPQEIVFTSCGTESDSTAIHSALAAQPGKRHLITTRVEHPAVLNVLHHLAEHGHEVTLLGVDKEGRLDLDELRASLRKDTALVSAMFANNETGVVFPIKEMAEICKERGVLFHTDAVQAVGKIPFSLKDLPADMLSLSAHKLHGPKGVGALFVRKGVRFRPFLLGGHQERGRRAGTENAAGLVGLGMACRVSREHLDEERTRVRELRDRLQAGLLAAIPDSIVNGGEAERLPNTLSVAFKYVEGEAILLHLDRFGICASSGSACTSGSLEPSHVLRAMGVPFTFAHGSIRFSLSRFTTDADIGLVLAELPGIMTLLREISPYKPGPGDAPAGAC